MSDSSKAQAMNDRIGKQFGNYRLVRLLGKGGFAEVYLGEHIHLGTEAAIKILHTRFTEEERARFRDEARIVARLIHPNIVRVLDFGIIEEESIPFLVMDLALRGSLRDNHPRGTRVPSHLVISYVKQVTQALQYAHENQLVHRDVKPENMLVGRNNEILLSDFGIAVMVQSTSHQSIKDVVGTVVFMAPEQIEGHPRPASDQYSLGIVVYEWLSGFPPFSGSFTEVAYKHTMVPPPPLRAIVPDLSVRVENVILKALQKAPQQRYESVQAFADALERAISTSILPSQSLPPTPTVKRVHNEPSIQHRLVSPSQSARTPPTPFVPMAEVVHKEPSNQFTFASPPQAVRTPYSLSQYTGAQGPTSMGTRANNAAGLSYVAGWITGLIFFFGEKQNRFVRFNAMQSILLYAAVTALYIVLDVLITALAFSGLSALLLVFGLLIWLVGIGAFVLWIILMINAFQGKYLKLPIIGDYAEKFSTPSM